MIYIVLAKMVGAVITNESLGETMELIWAVKVHSTDLHGLVSAGTQGMSKRWNA
tara:strand:- start:170 stop:331 length:162 start_codon:yes stop_codon:yes gene_type:complete